MRAGPAIATRDAAVPAQETPIPKTPTLAAEIKKLQQKAGQRQAAMWTKGVFVFFSTADGNAWVLEASGMDALQVAAAGTPQDAEVIQTPDAIEVTWSHRFTIRKDFTVIAYADQQRTVLPDYPAGRLRALLDKARHSLPPEQLAQIHLGERDEAVPD
ncbi:MAG: zinc chelation protein SecC [Gammaproteobacteria bacterium]